MALGAHARYATGDDVAHGQALFLSCRASALRVLDAGSPQLDYPAVGLLLFALGTWGLLRRTAPAAGRGAGCSRSPTGSAYIRTTPTMMLGADRAGGRGSRRRACSPSCRPSTADRQPPDLLAEARRLAERLPG